MSLLPPTIYNFLHSQPFVLSPMDMFDDQAVLLGYIWEGLKGLKSQKLLFEGVT